MFPADNIRDWRGRRVVDVHEAKIGELESIYVDTASDEPAFAAVKVGMIHARLIFVPLRGATVKPDALKLAITKGDTKDAPSIDTDGELLAEAEPAVFAHYGLEYRPGAGGERRLARR